jgi:hypothetical protein
MMDKVELVHLLRSAMYDLDRANPDEAGMIASAKRFLADALVEVAGKPVECPLTR